MTEYHAPVAESTFILTTVLDLGAHRHLDGFDNVDADTIGDILSEAAALAQKVLHPLNSVGDAHGCTLDPDGQVRTPPGFPEAYRAYIEGGWAAVGGDTDFGGNGLPLVLTLALEEYFWSSNQGFFMYGGSSRGVANVLLAHGTPAQKEIYVPRLTAGEWAGAMGLTEPQAGSDVGLVRTRAVAAEDSSYRISGGKIFTSGGDHDLAENVVHLMLARLEGAPEGSRGLSLFLVPKYLPQADGSRGERNSMRAIAVEHKMGIRASATCAMSFDSATGYLVGQPNQGLQAMFILMNELRLITAIQALGVSEIAYQNAAKYVRERRQGRAPESAQDPSSPADLLVAQPDVRRILLEIRTSTEAARALTLWTALQADIARTSADEKERVVAEARAALLTPVLKGAIAEIGFANTVAAQQLFGGHGYIVDTGVEQFVRDVRVSSIGEGVTAIQAWDLVRRKIGLGDGAVLESLLDEVLADATAIEKDGEPWRTEPLQAAVAHLREATAVVRGGTRNAAAATAVHYLHLFAQVGLGWAWTKLLGAAEMADPAGESTRERAVRARFFLERLPAQTAWRAAIVALGDDAIADLPDDRF